MTIIQGSFGGIFFGKKRLQLSARFGERQQKGDEAGLILELSDSSKKRGAGNLPIRDFKKER